MQNSKIHICSTISNVNFTILTFAQLFVDELLNHIDSYRLQKQMGNTISTSQLRRCMTFHERGWLIACAKKNKSWNFASIFWGLLEVGMESPKNDFQIYRPINDPRRAVSSLGGDIGGGMSKNRFRTITFDWSVLRT